jgi:hypothetical protein
MYLYIHTKNRFSGDELYRFALAPQLMIAFYQVMTFDGWIDSLARNMLANYNDEGMQASAKVQMKGRMKTFQ